MTPQFELPNPFRLASGEEVRSADDWRRRRTELLDQVVGIEYGKDWAAFLGFMDWQLGGRNPAYRFNENPYPDQPQAFSWSARDLEAHGGH